MVIDVETKRGAREDLIGLLADLAEGWDHLGNDGLSARCRAAADDLRMGAQSVRPGHIEYKVGDLAGQRGSADL
jgi:hypothetical protein